MAYETAEARREMLVEIAAAADDLSIALTALGEAYEMLDEANADRLEGELFGQIQAAYGRAKQVHAGFAKRVGLPPGAFQTAPAGHPSQGITGFLSAALDGVARADARLSELQDSMRPVDVGDAELRAGIAEVRQMLGDVPTRARDFMRTLGR